MSLVEQVRESLREVYDPELGVNVVDLGLVYDIAVEDGIAHICMTLTTPGCPMHDTIVGGVRWALGRIPEIRDVDVNVVWDPRWSPEMMTEAAKDQLYYR